MVDAGMRQIYSTGYMHYRTRMITMSFLCKILLVEWSQGHNWLWNHLVDNDLANYVLEWQWAAGCGTDTAPYTRIFSPLIQSRKFDKNGDYILKWIPALRKVPNCHEPFKN